LWMALYLAVHEFRERRRAEVNALRFELEAQTAQLRGLREQLNPHFLFNCLNSLREMIIENPQSAQAMVTQLSRLLRYSLQSNHIELVPLADELQAVRDYLDLEAVRYEDRLRVLWSIDCHDTSLAVPPMLLQTLVENALKHGIARLPEGGEIAIRITAGDGSKLTMEVVNSGEIAESPSANGIGLRNARSRLQLLYGDGAKMILESMAGHRVLACVTLPLTSSPYLTLPQTPSPDAILPATEARLESSAGR
ncbi:MAG TPA: histidine kinase, partial [Candidatus Angelobacter sp.]|nr:histidine kinase [Candidatus Angelobacter sp.]